MRRGTLIFALFFGLGGAAILAALSWWQVERLAWKEALIARIEAQLARPPVALPAAPDPDEHRYLAVEASGRFDLRTLFVLTSASPGGPGFRVIQPFETRAGRRILVDRGYLPEARKETPLDPGPMPVTGNLDWPRETDIFTPEPNSERNIWFAREVPRMAEALDTEAVLLVARAPTGEPSPRPLPVTVNLRNSHREYAITWAALAVCWLAMTGYLVYRGRRDGG